MNITPGVCSARVRAFLDFSSLFTVIGIERFVTLLATSVFSYMPTMFFFSIVCTGILSIFMLSLAFCLCLVRCCVVLHMPCVQKPQVFIKVQTFGCKDCQCFLNINAISAARGEYRKVNKRCCQLHFYPRMWTNTRTRSTAATKTCREIELCDNESALQMLHGK